MKNSPVPALAFATQKEMQAALSPWGRPPHAADMAQGSWTRLSLPGREVLVLVTGVSVVNAALGLGRLLEAEAVSGVLNLGIAGSFDTALLPLGATAAAESETWPEFGLHGSRGVDPEALGLSLHCDEQGTVNGRLDLDPDAAAKAMGVHPDPAWLAAHCLTVSAATGTARRAEALRRRHGALMENMEGFALALGCRRAGIPFLEVRTVSNAVGPRRPGAWKLLPALAALGRAARLLLGAEGGRA